MANGVKIRCKNNGKIIKVPLGSTLLDVFEKAHLDMPYGPVAAHVNNKEQGLKYRFYNDKDVEFLDLHTDGGMRTYISTLFLLLSKTVEDLFPNSQLIITANVSNGYYCELRIGRALTEQDVTNIRAYMKHLIEADLSIHRIQCPIEDAIELFRSHGMESKAQLLESQSNLYTYYYLVGMLQHKTVVGGQIGLALHCVDYEGINGTLLGRTQLDVCGETGAAHTHNSGILDALHNLLT